MLSLLIALVFDVIIVLIGRLLLPWNHVETDTPGGGRERRTADPDFTEGGWRQVLAAGSGRRGKA